MEEQKRETSWKLKFHIFSETATARCTQRRRVALNFVQVDLCTVFNDVGKCDQERKLHGGFLSLVLNIIAQIASCTFLAQRVA